MWVRRSVGFIPVVVLWVSSLIFVYSSQIFHDQGHTAIGNLMTAVGMLMTTSAGAFLGARFKAIEDDHREMRAVRRGAVGNHRVFLQDLAETSETIERANLLMEQGENVEGTILLHSAKEKLDMLRNRRPSSVLLAEESYRIQIDERMNLVYSGCNQLSHNSHSVSELNDAILSASHILSEYENG